MSASHSRERFYWTGALFSFAAVGGLAMQVRGALFVSFQETFGVSESLLGLVTPVGTVGFVLVVVTFGLLAGRIDVRRWLLVGVVGSVIGFLFIGAAPSFVILLAMVFARSASTGVFRALDRPLLSHLYPDTRGRIFNLQTMAWAVGATIGPLVVTLALYLGEWRLTYAILALVLLPILVVLWRLESPSLMENEVSFRRADVPELLARRELLVMGCALVLTGGIESVFFTWLPYYSAQFFTPGVANSVLSVYLVAYIPGRLVFSWLAGRARYLTIVLATAALTLVALGITFWFAGDDRMLLGVFAVGFLVSGLFPTLLAWGIDTVPQFTGPINAIALTSAQIGFFVFPAAVGVLADVYSIERAMTLQLALVAVLLCIVVVGRRYA